MSLINYFYLLAALFSLISIQTSKVAAFVESDQNQMEGLSKNHVNPKRGLFGQVIFANRRPTLTLEQFKRIHELAVERKQKEKETRLKQERREKIYRDLLAQGERQTSFHRDFHTMRY